MKGGLLTVLSIWYLGCPAFAQEPQLMLPIGHTKAIYLSKFSPDSKRIFTLAFDQTFKMWDVQSGKLLSNIKSADEKDLSVYFSKDGKMILSVLAAGVAKVWDSKYKVLFSTFKLPESYPSDVFFSADKKKIFLTFKNRDPMVWDMQKGKYLLPLKGYKGAISAASFSPDGEDILLACADSSAKVWNLKNGKFTSSYKLPKVVLNVLYSFDGKNIMILYESTLQIYDVDAHVLKASINGYNGYSGTMIFTDGRKITTIYKDSTAKVWDASSGAFITGLKGKMNGIYHACYSSNGEMLVLAKDFGKASVWNTNNGRLISETETDQIIGDISFSPDNKLLVTASDQTALVWNAQNGKLLVDFSGHSSAVQNAFFSPDGKKIVTSSDDGNTRLWDVVSGKLLLVLQGYTANDYISFDSKKIITIDKIARVWDTQNGKLILTLDPHTKWIKHACFSPDAERIATSTRDDYKAQVWNSHSGLKIVDLKGHQDDIFSVAFSPDSKKLVTSSNDVTIKIWDVSNGALLVNINRDTADRVTNAKFSPDGKKIITAYGSTDIIDALTNKSLTHFRSKTFDDPSFSPEGTKIVTTSLDSVPQIWDVQTGALLLNLQGHTGRVHDACFAPDGKTVLTSSADKTAKIWDSKNGRLLSNLAGHIGAVTSSSYSADGGRVLTTSEDNTLKIWHSTGELITTFFAIDSAESFNELPSGYYMCTPNAAKLLHYVTKNLEVITFDQLDIKYNRPDKVLEAIGCPDTALIRSYKRAYEKRIKKLGIDTTSFKSGYSIPKVDFFNRDKIENEQKQDKLILHITGSDSTYAFDRFNVWVNDVPVYGIKGISLKKANRKTLDTTVTIILSAGQNRIETSVININGTESYHIPLYVSYTPAVQAEEKLHFIGIGIDQFADNKYNLQWSVKDIHDLAIKFKGKYGSNCVIDTLFNQNVTLDKIIALKQKLQQTDVNDKVVIAYSGHGLLSRDYDYYLSSYNVNFDQPEQNGIPYDALENLLDSIPARRKLMLIDACNSGEVDKEELAKYTLAEAKLDSSGMHKGVKMLVDPNHKLGMKNSFELMRELFVNVGKSTGTTIISAAGGTQFALEKGDLKNGVFTYSILEYLKQPHCSISSLKQYVNKRVTELTAGMQVPTTRSETSAVDWQVW
jgi:WD40 repeat protein